MNDPSLDRSPFGDLVEEFLERWQRGERPTVEEFRACHPGLAGKVCAFLPPLVSAADELLALTTSDPSRRPPPDLFERLADAFRDLGDTDRAEQMIRRAG